MSSKLWTIQEICREITHLYDADCNMPTRWSVYKLICKVRDTSQAVLEENRQMHTRIVKLEQQVDWEGMNWTQPSQKSKRYARCATPCKPRWTPLPSVRRG